MSQNERLIKNLRRDVEAEVQRRTERCRQQALGLEAIEKSLPSARQLLAKLRQGLPELEREQQARITERDRLRHTGSDQARLKVLGKELKALDGTEAYLRRQLVGCERVERDYLQAMAAHEAEVAELNRLKALIPS